MGIIAGILIILISLAHNIYGEKKQIPALKEITDDDVMIGSLRIMIFQGGILLLAVGIIQLLVSTGQISLSGIAAYFPLALIMINFLTSLFIIILLHREILRITIPQFVVFLVIMVLQYLSLG